VFGLASSGAVFAQGTFGGVALPSFALFPPLSARLTVQMVATHEAAQHVLFLTRDGLVYAFGSGDAGQLGVKEKEKYKAAGGPVVARRVHTGAMKDQKAVCVAVGPQASAAVLDTGAVVTWGTGASWRSFSPVAACWRGVLSRRWVSDTRAVVAAMFSDSGCGELGWSRKRACSKLPRVSLAHAVLPNNEKLSAEKVALGANHALVLLKQGGVLAVGSNRYGECGRDVVETGPGASLDIVDVRCVAALPMRAVSVVMSGCGALGGTRVAMLAGRSLTSWRLPLWAIGAMRSTRRRR
jgi:alpha-tubulin suppressor-like RCC1 family protein